MGSRDKGREQEDALRAAAAAAQAKADAAVTKAETPDPLEERRRARVLAIDKWDMGESGPKDIRNLPGADTSIALFNDARLSHDTGRIGRGYGTMSDGANPNFLAALDKEMGLERDLEAAGALEGRVTDVLEGNKAELYGLSGISNSRNMGIAGLRASADQAAQDRFLQYLTRPKEPSFLKQLALAGVGAAGQVGAAYACVTADTLVHTPMGPNGLRAIGDIQVGDLVYAFGADGVVAGKARVIGTRREPSKVMEIRAGRHTLRCTASHVLQRFRGDACEIPVERFRVGHLVLTIDGRLPITSIVELADEEDVVILKLQNAFENFAFVTNGFLSLDDDREEQAIAA